MVFYRSTHHFSISICYVRDEVLSFRVWLWAQLFILKSTKISDETWEVVDGLTL